MQLDVVTGVSGSGKSIALHTLEDLGFYCIDNLPVFLLEDLARRLVDEPDAQFERTAVGIDARNASGCLSDLPSLITELRAQGVTCQTIFLDAQAQTLIKRFSETRRRHPLAGGERPLAEAIRLERQLLDPIRRHADLHIDTTHTNVHQLRDQVRARVVKHASGLSILLMSFGFKHGVPQDIDFVFDVRCLPNPHWQPELRSLTGRDAPVVGFLESNPGVGQMYADISGFLDRWIPAFETEGRSYLTIATGCTGGQHRSVYMTERLSRHLNERGRAALVHHRELPG